MIFVLLILILIVVLFGAFSARDRAVLLGRQHIFAYEGVDRTYRQATPKAVDDNTKLIVGIHGFGDSNRRFAYYTGLHNADPDAVVIYPHAVEPNDDFKTGWNAGFCCGSGWGTEADDAGFIAALVKAKIAEFNIDPDRVFVTGFSNGAFMTQRMLAEYPDLFRAGAMHSGSIGTEQQPQTLTEPVDILLLHGDQDTVVPFGGGQGSSDPNFTWLEFEDTKQAWLDNNGDVAKTEFQIYPGLKHRWYDWRLLNFWHKAPAGSQRIVEFFDSF